MKQAVMTSPRSIEFRDVPRPSPKAGEVLLAVRRIGVCGSDIHVYHGTHPYTGYPVVQGHEVSGTIAEIGPGVSGLRTGGLATFLPQIVCGTCYPCTHGMVHICDSLKVMGFQAPGAAQEFFPVPADSVVPLPDGMSAEAGAMVEPVAVAVHALRRIGDLAGRRILVLGAGPIGNLAAQCARALGAARVMATDPSAFRRGMAEKCGVDAVFDPARGGLRDAVRGAFGPDGADAILECVGSEAAMGDAVACARKGSTIVVVGVFGKKPVVDLGFVQDRELSVLGTLMYQRRDYETAIALAAGGKLRLEQLVTDRFPFAEYRAAYERIEAARDRVMKVMIEVG